MLLLMHFLQVFFSFSHSAFLPHFRSISNYLQHHAYALHNEGVMVIKAREKSRRNETIRSKWSSPNAVSSITHYGKIKQFTEHNFFRWTLHQFLNAGYLWFHVMNGYFRWIGSDKNLNDQVKVSQMCCNCWHLPFESLVLFLFANKWWQ